MPRRPVSAHASAAKIAQQQRCTRGGSQGKCHSYSILKFQGHRPLLLRTSCSLWVVYVTPVLRTRCTGSSDSISARCLRVLYIHDFTRRAKTASSKISSYFYVSVHRKHCRQNRTRNWKRSLSSRCCSISALRSPRHPRTSSACASVLLLSVPHSCRGSEHASTMPTCCTRGYGQKQFRKGSADAVAQSKQPSSTHCFNMFHRVHTVRAPLLC